MLVGERDGSGDPVGSVENLASPILSIRAAPPPGKASREDINATIDAREWAVVDATAAPLADSAVSDPSASSSLSGFLSSVARSARSIAFSMSSNAVERVQDWDQMVIEGD